MFRLWVGSLGLALTTSACSSCTGVATELFPTGVHDVQDAPLCPFEAPAAAPGASWSPMGPPGASVQALLALGQGVVLVGTGTTRSTGVMAPTTAGLFRSTDKGKTVARVLGVDGSRVNHLVAAPDGTVYAAVGSLSGASADGVYVSTDQGATFTALNAGLHTGARVMRLAVGAGTPTRLYALVSGTPSNPNSVAVTLYRKDGTADWVSTALTGVNIDPGGPLGAIAADTAARDTLYAIDGARMYVSHDAGETFTTVAQGWLGSPQALWVLGPGHLLLGTRGDGLFESTDGGVSWASLLVAVDGVQHGVFDVAVQGSSTLAATEGAGLQKVEAGQARVVGACLLDSVVLSVAAAPDDPTLVWVGTNGGLAVSDNGGESFLPAGQGLDELLGRFTVAPFDGEPTLFLASSAGLFYTSTSTGKWQRQGDWAKTVALAGVAFNAAGTDGFLAFDEELFPGRYGIAGGLWHWKRGEHLVSPVPEIEANAGALAVDSSGRGFTYQRGDPSLPQRARTGVYAQAALGTPFAQTSLLGEHFQGATTFRFSPLALAPDGTLYAGVRLADASPALLRSDDLGATQTQVWNGPGYITTGVYANAAGEVFLTGYNGPGILKSTDRGGTFTEFDTGLSGFGLFVYALAFDGNGGIVVGTEDGVQYAADGVHFTALNDAATAGLPVWSVAVLPASPKPVVAAGTARGLYWRTLP